MNLNDIHVKPQNNDWVLLIHANSFAKDRIYWYKLSQFVQFTQVKLFSIVAICMTQLIKKVR